ncbi:hypothetical protein VTN02DRAFT_4334 [Thermoascus thermophilus]
MLSCSVPAMVSICSDICPELEWVARIFRFLSVVLSDPGKISTKDLTSRTVPDVARVSCRIASVHIPGHF